MDKLTNLRPFVWFCQLIGFIPFRMEVDSETKKFQRFSFSFRHPLMLWFAVSRILIFVSFFITFYVVILYFPLFNSEWSSRKGFSYITVMIFQSVVSLMIQLTLIRCSRLRKAVELIVKADGTLKSISNMVEHKNTVTQRTFFGLLLIFIKVKPVEN